MADFTGMMQQLNSAVGRHPLAQQYNQSIPGMTPSPLDTVNPMLAGAVGGIGRGLGLPSGDFYTSPQKAAISDKAMGEAITTRDPKAMRAAAAVLLKQGRQAEALQMIQMADSLEAKQVAVLEEGQKDIEKQLLKAQEAKAISVAKRMALSKGDTEAAKALEGGMFTPQEYFKAVMEARAKQEPVSLADGAMLVGADGKILAENPKDFNPNSGTEGSTGPDLTSAEKKEISASSEIANTQGNLASRASTLANMFAVLPETQAGVQRTVFEAFDAVTGGRDQTSALLTDYENLRASEAMDHLPPGAASDADVALALKGVPPSNASNKEIAQWLSGVSKIAKATRKYNSFKSDYISENGVAGLNKAWNKENTPKAAIEALKKKPSEANKEAFKEHFGWLPEGI